MPNLTERRRIPFSQQQIFDMVADVEKYPAFLPRILASRVRHREGDAVYVDMLLGFGILRRRIGSIGVLSPPSRIDITSGDPPFRHLGLHWSFKPGTDGETVVALHAEFEFRSTLWQRLFDAYFKVEVAGMVDAFEGRARQIYAAPRS